MTAPPCSRCPSPRPSGSPTARARSGGSPRRPGGSAWASASCATPGSPSTSTSPTTWIAWASSPVRSAAPGEQRPSTEETERLTDLPTPARALAIGAHPDDVEFGCGATLAKWAEAGAEVRLLVLTDGSKGTWDPTADLGALVATRRREQVASAALLGLAGVGFLGRPAGRARRGRAEGAPG